MIDVLSAHCDGQVAEKENGARSGVVSRDERLIGRIAEAENVEE